MGWGGGGGYRMEGMLVVYARRVCSPLKETNLGMAQAFFDP